MTYNLLQIEKAEAALLQLKLKLKKAEKPEAVEMTRLTEEFYQQLPHRVKTCINQLAVLAQKQDLCQVWTCLELLEISCLV